MNYPWERSSRFFEKGYPQVLVPYSFAEAGLEEHFGNSGVDAEYLSSYIQWVRVTHGYRLSGYLPQFAQASGSRSIHLVFDQMPQSRKAKTTSQPEA
jgi:hypothetical protein